MTRNTYNRRQTTMTAIRCQLLASIFCLLTILMPQAHAEDSASAPLHLVVPFAPGGPSDLMARKLGEQLGARMHRSVIVDNKAGGGGSIAASFVSRAEPDGSTILWTTSTIAIDPVLRPSLPYDVQKDLTPIVTAMISPLVVLINPKLPVHDIAGLVAYAKEHPGRLNYGSGGVGTSLHMSTELFMLDTGTKMTHVPYKGASETVVGMLSNDIQLLFNPMPTALQYGKSGQLRALAVASPKRSEAWPELPTVAESGVRGLADFDASLWYALYAPGKTPKPVVDTLNKEINAALQDPSMKRFLREQGMETLGDTPEQARQRLDKEIHQWREVVKAAQIKLN
ncbi:MULTISPECIES: tripartite tricarboxylate transporter substrate binding protein [unclassified Achromobacter]|uniref:Bug family tripartite tricarboxylate transporter substrate binding protein n=1 Tax=unclassified Achromobacter TaxID=2626865 RepID=UPI0013033BAA|nr:MULTISPECIES: tripartite tricarboxylate transporter substrate binding protein [unclassified Achromobacter]